MRLERLLAIVMLLLNRRKATAKDLAEHFEVSVRTIQRDIDALSAAGFPVFAWQGRLGGYALLDSFKMDRNFLTASELELLRHVLTGLKSTYSDKNVLQLIEKFEHMEHTKPEKWNKPHSSGIHIDLKPWGDPPELREKIENLRFAIEVRRIVQFSYTGVRGEPMRRSVKPVTLVLKTNNWYVYGFCMTREDYRIFKLNRMTDLNVLSTTFENEEFEPYKAGDIESETDTRTYVDLKLKVNPAVYSRLTDYFNVEDIKKQEDGSFLVNVRYPEDEWVYSMLLGFGDGIEVLEPHSVRLGVQKRAMKIYSKYMTDNCPV